MPVLTQQKVDGLDLQFSDIPLPKIARTISITEFKVDWVSIVLWKQVRLAALQYSSKSLRTGADTTAPQRLHPSQEFAAA